MSWLQVCYEYDGTFPGFLTCVFDSYAHREEPMAFLGPEDGRYTLWPVRRVDTDRARADRVWRGIGDKLGPRGQRLAYRAFLTCLEDREVHIWRFLEYGFARGTRVLADLGDSRVDTLRRAVDHLEGEAHLYKGFVRFSDQGGVLLSEIRPKNRVLPLLGKHFAGRFNTERFLLWDSVHREALVHQPGQWTIAPLEELDPGPPGEEEVTYRRLWRRFFQRVAIQGRTNPRCQNTHLPKRFRNMMTEFLPDEEKDRQLPS